MILELKQEIKELKANNSYINQLRAKNNKSIVNWKYCWTHGYNLTHNRKVCRNSADNHQPKATIDNLMEGNLYYVGRYKQDKKKESSLRGRDTISHKLNYSNNSHSNL